MINSKIILDFFVVYLGNWQVIASVGILYFLLLRTFNKKFYKKLFNGIPQEFYWFMIYFLGILILLSREIMLYPFFRVQSWMPDSYLWEVFIMFLFTCHIPSILLYSSLIFVLWRKYQSLLPALYVGFLTIGMIEFSFIPQHYLVWRTFLGMWYYPFAITIIPFIIERKRFRIKNKTKMLFFIGTAIFLQYAILVLLPYSISRFIPESLNWTLNMELMPHPPLLSWIFLELNSILKIFFILGFSQINLVKKEEK